MPPKDYRYYYMDSDGHIHFAEWISAEDDEQAIQQVRVSHPDAKCEIWERHRLVARLLPSGFSPDNRDLQAAVGARLSALALRINRRLEP